MMLEIGKQFRPSRRLRPGDRVRLVSPCSPPYPDRLKTGMRMLADWGLTAELARPVDVEPAIAPPVDRAQELQAALEDPGVHAVLVTRAGTGADELLPYLDFTALERQPKPVCGFSDVTFLHAALALQSDRPSFHTPELAWNSRLNGRRSAESLRLLLMGRPSTLTARETHLRSHGPSAGGRLRGGNLSILARTEPPAPAAGGDVLFLEELRETPDSLGVLLDLLVARGHLQGVSAVVLGQFVDCGEPDAVRRVIEKWCDAVTGTVLAGVQAGHGPEQESLALNTLVSVHPHASSLDYCSDPTSPDVSW